VPALTPAQARLLEDARRAVLATIRADGRPRLVPITFAFPSDRELTTLYTPIDEKPKAVADPRRLGRVRDILIRPRVTVLVDRWVEDWAELAWLRLEGTAQLLEPDVDSAREHAYAVTLLRARYRQYSAHRLDRRPVIRIDVETVAAWSAR
jgi:coenzyme F420-0:L-glutamate ligase / coenzyme F420-1:gamma-L-glutamate ligase